MNKISHLSLRNLKENNTRFAAVTCYESSYAWACEQAEIEVLLVGDSLGMVIQGRSNTLEVKTKDIAYHTQAVAQGCTKPLIMSDMPFMAARSISTSMDASMQLMQAGAHMIKIEGDQWLIPHIKELAQHGVPVCAHLGLTPQHVHAFGGFKVQAKLHNEAVKIVEDALALQEAGASMLLFECIPSHVGEELSKQIKIPTIGIGAGPSMDGQILVMHDLLGLHPNKPAKFVKNYLELANPPSIITALKLYKHEVVKGIYPSPEHTF